MSTKDQAQSVTYDNTTSGLTATELQAAVDELAAAGSVALQLLYPVGSIYFNASDITNPNTLFGFGTWVRAGAGRVLVDIDTGDTDFDTLGETGGAKTHALTEAEMPAHTHDTPNLSTSNRGSTSGSANRWQSDLGGSTATDSTGSGTAHNNVQPYLVVAMWERTA